MGVFSGFLLLLIVFFGSAFPLSAQTEPNEEQTGEILQEGGAGSFIDESSIILGETAPVPLPNDSPSVFVVLRMVLVLALAALAIYGVVFFIKRLARPRENIDPHLKILARVPLSSDSFAAVVSLGAKAWLVGGGSGGINLISEIDDNESLETMLIEDARRTAEAGTRRLFNFSSLLRKPNAAQNEKKGSVGISLAETLRKQRERLGGQ